MASLCLQARLKFGVFVNLKRVHFLFIEMQSGEKLLLLGRGVALAESVCGGWLGFHTFIQCFSGFV